MIKLRYKNIVPLFWAAILSGGIFLGGMNAFENFFRGEMFRVQCLSYSPGTFSWYSEKITRAKIASDLEKVKTVSNCVRIYTSAGKAETVIAEAQKLGMEVILGSWIDGISLMADGKEVADSARLAEKYANVSHLVVGNEVLLFQRMKPEQLIFWIEKAKSLTQKPVSTGENLFLYLTNRNLVEAVDFVGFHIFPYWVRVPNGEAVDFSIEKIEQLQKTFAPKEVFALEIGWPSNGTDNYSAKTGVQNQYQYLKNTTKNLESMGIKYNVNEAFDQSWKIKLDGRSDGHFGVFDVWGNGKYEPKNWIFWLWFWGSIMSFLGQIWFLRRGNVVEKKSVCLILQTILGGACFLGLLFLGEIFGEYAHQSFFIWLVIVPLNILIFAEIWNFLKNLAEIYGLEKLQKIWSPIDQTEFFPKVSIHIPFSSERAETVIGNLKSVQKLKYGGKIEVLVVANNTKGKEWKKVKKFLDGEKDARFQFFHVEKLSGFKAAALNFALKKTDLKAQIITLLDADYRVDSDYLAKIVGHFETQNVGAVQCPQDHEEPKNLFQRIINEEYRGFFQIGMVNRNESNAIILHGTMVSIRAKTLRKLGWSENHLAEDAELGLRILARGHEIRYINQSFGRGQLPSNFWAYFAQRMRWAGGAVQILKSHFWLLTPFGKSELNGAQKSAFWMGWLSWSFTGLYLLFLANAILVAHLILTKLVYIPPKFVLYLPLFCLFMHLVFHAASYWKRVGRHPKVIFYSFLAGLAVVPAVSLGGIKTMIGLRPSFAPTHSAIPNTTKWIIFWGFLFLGSGILAYFTFQIIERFAVLANLEIFLWSSLFVFLILPVIIGTFLAISSLFFSPKNPNF